MYDSQGKLRCTIEQVTKFSIEPKAHSVVIPRNMSKPILYAFEPKAKRVRKCLI